MLGVEDNNSAQRLGANHYGFYQFFCFLNIVQVSTAVTCLLVQLSSLYRPLSFKRLLRRSYIRGPQGGV